MKKQNWLLHAIVIIQAIVVVGSFLHGADTFQSNPAGTTLPGYNSSAVTPSDSTDLPYTARAVYVGTGGDVAMELQNDFPGTATVFKNVASGTTLPFRARRIHSTSTTASNIVEVW